ncbi:MAG: T9SS type A sorting domain-containing protein [Flavobacteriales bacterium]|nr:T9SS type A sorting domain-containing protein [Flavobacteriales bacterium]
MRNSRLIEIGTAAQPVIFEKAGSGKWGGFIAVGTTDPLFTGHQVQMEYCIGRDATTFMDLDIAYHTPYNFINCEFSDNTVGFDEGPVSFVMNQYLFDQCDFHDNGTALGGGYFYTITNCTFENNIEASYHGYWVTGCTFINNELAQSFGNHVDGNTFIGNTVAVEGNWAGSMSFTNNVVVNNGTGIRMGTYFNGNNTFTGNIICGNSLFNIERWSKGSNNMANLSGNCFCTDVPAEIEETIYHAVDDISVGLIVFSPFDTDPGCLNYSVGTPDFSPPELTFYPNPTADFLTVTLPSSTWGPAVLTLFDATGRAVVNAAVMGPTLQLDVGDLSNGSFQAVLRTDGYVTTRRLIIMH